MDSQSSANTPPPLEERLKRPRKRLAAVLLVLCVLAAGLVASSPTASADHIESKEQGDISRDSDTLHREGGTWYRGQRGGTGSNGFYYTYDHKSYANWHFGELRGLYRAELYYPGQDAIQKGSCKLLGWNCTSRPPTASPRIRILQDDGNGFEVIYDWKTSIRDNNGKRKEGWWGWNNVELNGYIIVQIRKRYQDDKYRLAADSFRLKHRGLFEKDRRVAIEFCKANALS